MDYLRSGPTLADFNANGNTPQSIDKLILKSLTRKVVTGSLSQVALDKDATSLDTSSSDNGLKKQSDARQPSSLSEFVHHMYIYIYIYIRIFPALGVLERSFHYLR